MRKKTQAQKVQLCPSLLVLFCRLKKACIIRLINSCFWKQRNVWIRKCLNYSAFYWNYSQHIKYISSQQKQQHSPIYMGYFQGSLPILKYVQQELFNPCSGVSLPAIHLHSVDNLKFRLHTLASFMLFLLCSYLHLWIMEAGNSKTPLAGEVYLVVWWGHHWEYNPFLIQSKVHTVFTPFYQPIGRDNLLQHEKISN